ncbi:hypothetical protein ACFU93_32150 [Streptomyces sp. NPDC057611]|uniref:effector-associated constant component EACC1 n=1 Tax=Streptomyces sp. NPDC057611 TaxID=3346182 RepID=UPI0036B767B0
MHIQVQVDGSRQEEELRSLQEWLRAEPAIRRSATLSLHEKSGEPGSMGSLIDALQLVTGNGWSAASFVLSFAAWRQTRPKAPHITIRRGDVEVNITEATEEELRRLVNLLEQVDDSPRSSS